MLDLHPEPSNERVDTALGHERFTLPDFLEQSLAREHVAAAGGQAIEETELVRGNGNVVDRGRGRVRCAGSRRRSSTAIGRAAAIGSIVVAPPAAGQRGDASGQFFHAERLGQVVVGALDRKPASLSCSSRRAVRIRIGTSRFGLASDGAAEGQAVDARQHHVQHDHIEWLVADDVQRLPAVRHGDARVTLRLEMGAHEVADVVLVLDDEQLGATRAARESVSIMADDGIVLPCCWQLLGFGRPVNSLLTTDALDRNEFGER